MKKFIVASLFALQFAGFGVASAQQQLPMPDNYSQSVFFTNNTGSPVWLTIYGSKGMLDTWHIIGGANRPLCVLPHGVFSSPSPLDGAPYQVRVRTESKKGHGDCNTGTYNDADIKVSAGKNIMGRSMGQNYSAQLDVDGQGRSHLYWGQTTESQ